MPGNDFSTWTRFDETFDSSNGGCLYLRRSPDAPDDEVLAAGVLWLDGGQGDLHYYACVARFAIGEKRYADADVHDIFDAAEAFNECLDSEVDTEIGWFATMDEAVQAVEDAVSAYLT